MRNTPQRVRSELNVQIAIGVHLLHEFDGFGEGNLAKLCQVVVVDAKRLERTLRVVLDGLGEGECALVLDFVVPEIEVG